MLFNSIEFLIFLPLVFFGYWFVFKSLRWQNLFVVAVSYLFYGWWDWRFLLLILFTSLCSYLSGVYLEKCAGNRSVQKWISAGNILLNLSILGVFKYFDFFTENLVNVLHLLGWDAERDEDSSSPSGAFDGLFTKIDMLITGGDVNAARGNFAQSGLFVTPTSDTDYAAYENLVEWIGGANTYLRSSKSGIPQLQCAETVLKAARAALRNKLRMQEYPSMQRMIELLREDAMCPALEIVSHEALGQGSRLVLQKKGNMDVAFNTQAATKFCQIRDIYEDPNEWQFWLQTGYDTRIRDWHEKAFRCNEQKNESLDLAGDYCKTGAIQVDITGADNGTWSIQGKAASRTNGQCILGLAPGNYTIEFNAVDGKNKPANKQVTVVAGEVVTATGTYS